MDKQTSERLCKRLQSQGKLDELNYAVEAIRYIEMGVPSITIARDYLNRPITAGEYITTRSLWDLVKG